MQMLGPHDSLFFLHIPKTAGSSLIDWLADHFAPWEAFHRVPASLYDEASDDELTQYRFFYGHLRPEFAHRLRNRVRTITFLREPTARLHSSYRYLRSVERQTADLIVNEFARKQMEAARSGSFEDWLRLPHDGYFHHNHVTYTYAPFGASGDQALAQASAMLESFAMFGLVERMQDSIDLLCYQFAWMPSNMDRQINVTRSTAPSAITPEVAALTRRTDGLDHALYEIAARRFERRWQAMIDDLICAHGLPLHWDELPPYDRRLSLHTAIGHHSRFIRQYETARRKLTVKVDSNLDTVGFSRLIRPDPRFPDLVVRWLGPEPRGTILLPLPKSGRSRLTFAICEAVDIPGLSRLEIRINGQLAEYSIRPQPIEHYPHAQTVTVSVEWGAVLASDGLSEIEFRLPGLSQKPRELDHPGLPDQVGFTIREFTIETVD